MIAPPTFADVEAAASQLRGAAVLTPLLESPLANAELGGRLLVKAEPLQRTGSFKFRGAWNKISRLSAAQRDSGVVAYSSGNHAQAVAHAAALCGARATIVMPADAPAAKIEATRAYGAEVVLYDRLTESREAIGAAIARETGAVLVPPFDDPQIIAGQGTAGLEIVAQAKDAGAALDEVVVCASGGGLIAGIALAVKALSPATAVWGAEPAGFDDLARSLAAGVRVENAAKGGSIQDALLTPSPGAIPFEIHKTHVAGAVAVTDDEALAAMAFAFRYFRLVVEPGGAAALAAVLSGKRPIAGRTVAVVASGGNVDPEIFARALRVGA